jgi:hypothetical protein
VKKFCAVVGAALLNAACFILGWLLLLDGYGNFFLFYINPVLTGAIFLLLGSLFHKRFQLSRVPLWFSMNLLGEVIGWAGIFLLSPEMLSNLMGVFMVMFFRFWGFAFIWMLIGAVWTILHIARRWGEKRDRQIIEETILQDKKLTVLQKSEKSVTEKGPSQFKILLKNTGMFLCFLSVVLIGMSVYYTFKERPAEAYEDKGIYTFKAHSVYPTQVKNTTNRYNRRQTTRTVYMVAYKTTVGSGYQWKEEAPTKSTGNQWIKEGKTTQRRVLSIKETNKYITVDPKYTAETYVSHNKSKYTIILLVSGLYLIGYVGVWIHKREKQRLEEE